MKRAILIEDEARARAALRNMLQDYCPEIEAVAEADGVASALEVIGKTEADILFLDVQLKDGTAFDLLDQYAGPYPFHLIFTTAHDEFAVKAFEYHALDYLVKPIAPGRLCDAVARAGKRLPPSTPHYLEFLEAVRARRFEKIALSTKDGILFMKLDDLLRLEASGNYTTFHSSRGQKVMVARTLKDYENLLGSEGFFRTHQSHIVNLAKIEGISKDDGGYACLEGGDRIPIARRRRDHLVELLRDRSLF